MSDAPKPGPSPEPQQAADPKRPVPSLEPRNTGPRLRELDAEIERELQEAMGELSSKELYGEPEQHRKRPSTGPATGPKKGRVLSVRSPDVFVEVPGGRSQGVLPLLQFPEGPPAPGTEVDVTIEGYDPSNGLLLLSRRGAAMIADWSSVAEGMTVEARVTEVNKGGLTVDVNGIRGFMPISQIDLYRVEQPEQYVNQRLLAMVVEVNPEERNLVVSRRDLLEKEREVNRERLWNELAEGQVRDGIVRSVKDFGAFVDLGGVDGMVHVSEMSWTRVGDATTVLQPGQSVKVIVLKIDRERRKVSLGMKQLTTSPWDTIMDRYGPGAVVTGKVTRLMEFGAFVELEPGIEGLVHISELAGHRVFRVKDVVQPDLEVKVKVLSVDQPQRRIALSLKAAIDKEPEKVEEEEAEEVVEEKKPPRPRTTPLRGGLNSQS